jgi:excisionase family DNA binding protein
MDAAAAAVFLGVSVSTIRLWTRTGVIGHLRFGGTVRYTIEHLLNPVKVERSLNRLGFSAVFMRVTSPVGVSGL